jgi:hypothetical protein
VQLFSERNLLAIQHEISFLKNLGLGFWDDAFER